MEYQFSSGQHISKEKAPIYGEYLRKFAGANHGNIKPQVLVKAARSHDCPLHDYFEWDDSVACHKWRVEQARYLIRSIQIVINDSPPIRAFLSIDFKDNGEERGYVSIDVIAKDEGMRKQVVENALKEVIGWKEKYKNYQELAEIFGVIEETQKRLFDKRKHLAPKAEARV